MGFHSLIKSLLIRTFKLPTYVQGDQFNWPEILGDLVKISCGDHRKTSSWRATVVLVSNFYLYAVHFHSWIFFHFILLIGPGQDLAEKKFHIGHLISTYLYVCNVQTFMDSGV